VVQFWRATPAQFWRALKAYSTHSLPDSFTLKPKTRSGFMHPSRPTVIEQVGLSCESTPSRFGSVLCG
jgi:hypothetical protein